MLLDFSVENFKSIRDEAHLNLVSTTDKSLIDTHTIYTGIDSLPNVSCCAAIYGANACGKSNLIDAMFYMRAVVIECSNKTDQDVYNVKSFRLDPATEKNPTKFEITFLLDGTRYQYGFSMTPQRIVEEWLLVYKTSKPQEWFYRENDSFHFGSFLKGQKKVWEKSTRPKTLFLSTASLLNSDQLKPIYNWIIQSLNILGPKDRINDSLTLNMLEDPNKKNSIIGFISSADISIDDITVIEELGQINQIHFDAVTGKTKTFSEEGKIRRPQFHHKGKIFELGEESLGTQRLFYLVGPILDILDKGSVLIFDELDSSIHTLLARKLINLFNTPSMNQKGAQLIFSSHNTALLSKSLLRRDQIWFLEKDYDQASTLFPLSDLAPRKNEDLEGGYLKGRYGAIPILNDFEVEVELLGGKKK